MSQDLIFPLLPRNTKVELGNDLERVKQLQKKQKIKGVRPEEDGGETQHARIEERQRKMQEESKKEHDDNNNAQSQNESEHLEHDEDSPKGHNLDTFA